MPRFKIGQKVVALKDHALGWYLKGDEFIVDGFHECVGCRTECIFLRGLIKRVTSICSSCGMAEVMVRQNYFARNFAPIEPIREKIKYTFKVNIPKPEIIEREQLIPLKELINNQ